MYPEYTIILSPSFVEKCKDDSIDKQYKRQTRFNEVDVKKYALLPQTDTVWEEENAK